jgi:NTE family protein
MAGTFQKTDPDLALCLSGGAGLGFVHLGLFEALEELDIHPSLITGTSMGAVMGAFYAAGMSSVQIRQILKEFKWSRLVALKLSYRGVLSTNAMQSQLINHLGDIDITDLPVKLKIAAIKLKTGELAKFEEGPLAKSLAASCAMAGLFQPVDIDGVEYYDAGPVYNLPLELVSGEKKKTVIAGNTVGKYGLLEDPKTLEDVLHQTYLIQQAHQCLWHTGPMGWLGKKREKVILIDYHTVGAKPRGLDDCLEMIETTRREALKVLARYRRF